MAPCARLEVRTLIDAVEHLFSRPQFEPPMIPAIALQVHRLTNKPDVEYAEVRRLLESDPMLTARVLRVAQSAAFAGPFAITSVHEAMVRLGLRTLGELFLQVATGTRVFRAKRFEGPMERLRTHSVATAHVARLLHEHHLVDDDGAFLAGLLHAIGSVISLVALAEPGLFVQTFTLEDIAPTVEEAQGAVGAVVARAWKLPPELAEVVSSPSRPPFPSRLAHCVHLASRIAEAASLDDREVREASQAFGVSEETFDAISQSLAKVLARVA